ncbi:MAG: GNAT family N-acetyltransferase [Saonia sp.]
MKDLIDLNFQRHASQIPSEIDSMQVIQTENILMVDSGLCCDTFNIIHIKNGASVTKSELSKSIGHYREKDLDFCIWSNSQNLTPELGENLRELSIFKQNEEIGMALNLKDYNFIYSDRHKNISQVTDRNTLSDYSKVLASNWNPPDGDVISYYEKTSEKYVNNRDGVMLFVYYDDHKPVATVELFPSDKDTIGIYGLATLEDARGKGIGSSLMTLALNKAKALNYKNVVLQASEDGIGIYKKLGFKSHTTYREFA